MPVKWIELIKNYGQNTKYLERREPKSETSQSKLKTGHGLKNELPTEVR